MIETTDLIMEKARFSDWKGMLKNVWSHPESAQYMMWNVTTEEEDAKIRIQKTIEFQKTHDTYLVYEKKSHQPIGFAGIELLEEFVVQEAGICLGPDYVRRGYGKQILAGLIQYSKEKYNAKEFIYSTREKNIASKMLAESFGFEAFASEEKKDDRNGESYRMIHYRLKL